MTATDERGGIDGGGGAVRSADVAIATPDVLHWQLWHWRRGAFAPWAEFLRRLRFIVLDEVRG